MGAYLFGSPAAGQAAPTHVAIPAPPPGAATVESLATPAGAAGGPPQQRGFPPDEDAPVFDVAAAVAAASGSSATATATAAASAAAAAPYPYTRWAFREGVASFTPEDFSTLQRCIKEEVPAPSLRHVLALLRLANHDAEVFAKFKAVVIDKAGAPGAAENTQRDVRGDVDRIYAAYFPLVPSKDTCFELGRVLMSLRVSARAGGE